MRLRRLFATTMSRFRAIGPVRAAGIIRLAALSTALLAGCAPSDDETDFEARRALLQRQNQGLRELIAEEEQGGLVPRDRFLIGLDEAILADIFRSQLPIEKPVGEKFIVRLEKAEVLLRDKYGSIVIEGSAHRRATPGRRVKLRILGGLGAVAIDPADGRLNIAIAIDRIDFLEAGLLEGVLGAGGKKLFAEKGREKIQEAIPNLQVPVVLGKDIRIPAMVDGDVRLDALNVPLNLSVDRVLAAGGKLWVTLNAEVGRVTGADEGLGVKVGEGGGS